MDAGIGRGHSAPRHRTLALPWRVSVRCLNHASDAPWPVQSSVVAFPHPDKVRYRQVRGKSTKQYGYGGADAYSVSTVGRRNLLVVADGIAAWQREGIDSGAVSRALVQTIQLGFTSWSGDCTAAGVPQQSWDTVLQQEPQLLGSTTVCMALIDEDTRKFHTAMLGDSVCVVVRKDSTAAEGTWGIHHRTVRVR